MVAGLQILSSCFLAYQSLKFITLPYGEIPYLGGPLGSLRVKETCQYLHLAKIQEIKCISKPPLRKEIYTICQNLSLDNYRKEHSTGSPQKSQNRSEIGSWDDKIILWKLKIAIGIPWRLHSDFPISKESYPTGPLTANRNRQNNLGKWVNSYIRG